MKLVYTKMVRSAVLQFRGLCTLKKSGQPMTHHSGLILSFDEGILYPYRRVSSNDLTIRIHKYEVIDKGSGKGNTRIVREISLPILKELS